jgi:SH3 domain protein
MRLIGVILVTMTLIGTAAHAETGYINDEFEITLRSGESTKHSIVRMLASGTRIEVLSSNPDSGYSQVLTGDGAEGYVLSRFISQQPVARDRLARTQQRFEKLQADKAALDESYAGLLQEKQDTETERARLEARNTELSSDLEEIRRTSANVLNIDRQNKELDASLKESEETIARLRTENQTLAARSAQRWFMLGGGAVLVGALLGFLLPRMRWRRRSSWGDL